MKRTITITNNTKTNIYIKNKYIQKYLKKLDNDNFQTFCIVDKNIKNYLEKFKQFKNINFIYVKCNEELKNNKNYYKLCNILIKKKIDRRSVIVAIGGGTLGDLCGYIASTILRGVDFKLIPTTLLSQVDSSIGGKNGINLSYGKNLVGTFYHPSDVIIDIDILKTLPKREFRSGYAEIIKHALIKDLSFFKWLDKNYLKLFRLDQKILEKAIFKSILIKLWYVQNDPKEQLVNFKSRAMLNYGHTFGHAIEAYYKYSKEINHGEAISIGMIIESKISNILGYLKNAELDKIVNHFSKLNLKTNDKNFKNKKIIDLLKNDKKNLNNKINIVLLKGIGKSFYYKNIKINEIENILNVI